MKKATDASAEDVDPRFTAVVKAFARDPRVSQKRLFGSKAVLNVDGKIFAMLVRGRFVAKLPKARVDELVRVGKGVPFDPGHGRLMKEWLSLTDDETSWLDLAREAHRFVAGGRKA